MQDPIGDSRRFQKLSLDPDPKTRIPSNFWIEAFPVLNVIDTELPQLARDWTISHNGKASQKDRAKKIKSVIHFRRIMEADDLAHDDQTRKSVVLRRLEEFVLKPDLDTRTAFDELVLDRKRIQTAVAQCEQFIAGLQQLRLSNTSDPSDRRSLVKALQDVRSYCKSLLQHLAMRVSEDPEIAEDEEN